jgi:alkylation response protein AidB-like acyl-CoA dehydrogenase
MCVRAVDRLFEDAGAHGLHQSSPLQRAFRDLHALSAHAFIHSDACGELYGRMRTGQALAGPV